MSEVCKHLCREKIRVAHSSATFSASSAGNNNAVPADVTTVLMESKMYRFILCLIWLPTATITAQGQVDLRQPNGPVDLRVDGRANKQEGLPPSAADKGNRTYGNPVYETDCAEIEQLNPNARRRYQSRIRRACEQ